MLDLYGILVESFKFRFEKVCSGLVYFFCIFVVIMRIYVQGSCWFKEDRIYVQQVQVEFEVGYYIDQ